MTDPRYIFSWQIQPEIKVFDKVKVIATPALMQTIGFDADFAAYLIGSVFTVSAVQHLPFYSDWGGSHGYKGVVIAKFSYPLSHWRDFLEIVEPARTASLKLGWQVQPEPVKRAVDDIIDPLGAPIAFDYHTPMEKILLICPWCAADIGEAEPTNYGEVYNKGFELMNAHMPNCPNKEETSLDNMMVTIKDKTTASLKFGWRIQRELKNGLNTDVTRRDQIIFGNANKTSFGGLAWFDRMTLTELKQLVEENFISLTEHQGSSPTVQDFLTFMEDWPMVKAHGYAVDLERADYRVTIEGLIYAPARGNVPWDLQVAFQQFNNADEYRNELYEVRCWWE